MTDCERLERLSCSKPLYSLINSIWSYRKSYDNLIWLQGHKSETVSILISISLSVKEYIEEK